MERNENRIAAECASGDFGNFDELYQVYLRKIHDFMFFRTYHRELAEDLTSQTFTKAVDRFSTYRPKTAGFAVWIYRIARNTLYDHFRAAQAVWELPENWEIASGENIERQFDAKAAIGRVREFLSGLPQDTRDIVVMRLWDGLSYAEIGEMVGKSEAAAKMVFLRTLSKLKAAVPLSTFVLLGVIAKL